MGTWEEAQEEDGHLGAHGGNRGRRSQGGDKRGLEQEEPSRTQVTIMTVSHGEADRVSSYGGGRANNFRGPTNGGRAVGRGARGRDRE